MYCGHCGAPVGEQDTFCNTCGARFVEPAPLPPPTSAIAAPAAGPTTLLPPAERAADGLRPARRRGRTGVAGGRSPSARRSPSSPSPASSPSSPCAATRPPPGPTRPVRRSLETDAPRRPRRPPGRRPHRRRRRPRRRCRPPPRRRRRCRRRHRRAPCWSRRPPRSARRRRWRRSPPCRSPTRPTTVAAAPAPTSRADRRRGHRRTRPHGRADDHGGHRRRRAAHGVDDGERGQSSATRPTASTRAASPPTTARSTCSTASLDSAWMTVGSGGGQHLDFTLRKGVEVTHRRPRAGLRQAGSVQRFRPVPRHAPDRRGQLELRRRPGGHPGASTSTRRRCRRSSCPHRSRPRRCG